jgi:hypothetical protein
LPPSRDSCRGTAAWLVLQSTFIHLISGWFAAEWIAETFLFIAQGIIW